MARALALLAGLAALTVGAPAVSAAEEAPMCRYEEPPPKLPKAERRLREEIGTRKGFGLPHSRAYVKRVLADPRNRRRGFEYYSFPITKREARYFDQRTRVEDAADRVRRYTRRHRDVFGGLSIEDGFPRGAYIRVRFTERVRHHRAEIARRFPYRVAARRVDYSERHLGQVQDRLDWDAFEREGIHVVASYTALAANRVQLEVATERTDAAEVALRLGGPEVRLRVLGPKPYTDRCATPKTFEPQGDGRTLELVYYGSGSSEVLRPEVIETPDAVYVGVVVRSPFVLTADLQGHPVTATLAEPLGGRPVLSIQRHKPLERAADPR